MLRARTCLEMVRYTQRGGGKGEENEEWEELAGDVLEERGDDNTEREVGLKRREERRERERLLVQKHNVCTNSASR